LLQLTLPGTDLPQRALDLARRTEHPSVLNHSLRTFLYASLHADSMSSESGEVDRELLFVACVLHDVGTADVYNGEQRFEVDGADAAADFLRNEGRPQHEIDSVWEAIALHTSPGIAERLRPLTRLTRLGVLADFGQAERIFPQEQTAIEVMYPRLNVERELGNRVVRQALARPQKAPASSWPGILLAAHKLCPQWERVNAAF